MKGKHPRRRKTARPHRVGAPPGTLRVDPLAPKPVIHVMSYGPHGCVERHVEDVTTIPELMKGHPLTWVNVDGLGDARTLEQVAEIFGVHRLALEDVVHVVQRSKVEPYGAQLFMVARSPRSAYPLETEQFSLFFGKGFVLTFQEQPGDCLDGVRDRIRQGRPVIRAGSADYLAYALLDSIVDAYFPILERYGDVLEDLETRILAHPERAPVSELHLIKRDLTSLRRFVWPLRELLGSLTREDTPHFSSETKVYLRDCYDHAIQIMDLLESYRDVSSGLMELYLSSVSHRMNEVMKVLTMIATLFIPLSFITGIYGMNFDTDRSRWNMPELHWVLGYPFALMLMAITAIFLLFYFRRKGWIGPRKKIKSEVEL